MKRDWLIQLRKSKGLTQEQVATSAFIDRGYYSQIENGKRYPSPNVASNIARAINFNPMLFFKHQDQLKDKNAGQSVPDWEPTEWFRMMEIKNILYLYNHSESYIQNAVNFLLTGVGIGNYCIIIDYEENVSIIQDKLEAYLTKNEVLENIFFFHKDETITFPQELKEQLKVKKAIHVWSHVRSEQENDVSFRIEDYLNRETRKYLFILSYNASIVTARAHIRMMRQYPYLMTDFEIVSSPLFQSNNSLILPSLSTLEDL